MAMLECQGSPRAEYDADDLWRAIEASKGSFEDETNLAMALKNSMEGDMGRLAFTHCEGALRTSQDFEIGDEVVMNVMSHADIGVPVGSCGFVVDILPDGSLHVSFPQGNGYYMKQELSVANHPRSSQETTLPQSNLEATTSGVADTPHEYLLRATALAAEAEAALLEIAISASLGCSSDKGDSLPLASPQPTEQLVSFTGIETGAEALADLQFDSAASDVDGAGPTSETNTPVGPSLSSRYVCISTPPLSPRIFAETDVDGNIDGWDDEWTFVATDSSACSTLE